MLKKVCFSIILSIVVSSCSSFNNTTIQESKNIEIEGLTASNNTATNKNSIKIAGFTIKENGYREKLDDHDDEDDDKNLDEYEKNWDYNYKPTLKIDDVIYDGKSILKTGLGEIKGDFSKDKDINLTLKGKFKTWKPIRMQDMLFTYEAGLLQQSVVGSKPRVRVLLDDSILLSAVSVSETEIRLRINSKYIPEFYLKGLHKLTLEARRYFTDTLIKVGEPEPVDSLNPSISKIEVIKDEKNKPVNLKLTGKNFMMYYRFSYSTIDGVFGFGHQTNILTDGTYETIVHIPNRDKFDITKKHSIMYATPFGVAFREF